jgi:glutamate carboxypeptidase
VVAEAARARIDIRAADQAGVAAIEAALRAVASHHDVPETSGELSGEMRHLPFEQSEASARLFALAHAVGAELGLDLMGAETGGASDGNTAAGLGEPTLDGLGPSGGLAHNPGEYVEVASLAPRVALLAGLLRRVSEER